MSSHFGSPFLVPLYPRTCVPSTKIQWLAGLSFNARVCCQFGCHLFWCLFTHAHASQAQIFSCWLVSCSARVFFQFGCYIFCAPLRTPMRPKHRALATGWYPAVHAFSSSVRMLPCLEPLPLYSALPCISIFCLALYLTVGLQTSPYQRRLDLNYEVWVGL